MGLTDFGKVVKKKLIDKDMTQAQLAAMIGCGNQYLHKTWLVSAVVTSIRKQSL